MYDAVSIAQNAGLSPALAAYFPRFIQIESGGDPNAQTGSYSGLLQMGPDEQAKYGGNGALNGALMYADNAKWFQNKYGRQPSPTELYLTAQQGQGGLSAHLANPDAPAWQNMYSTAEGQQKGAAWAKKAIWGNVPDDLKSQFGNVNNLTSQQFLDLWQHKVERTPLKTGGTMNPLMAMLSGSGDNTPVGSGILNGAFNQNPWNIADGIAGLGAGLMAAGGNPYAGAAMMNSINSGRQQMMPKFTQIGTDEMGQPTYGWVRPSDMAIFDLNGKRMNVNGAGGGTAGTSMSSQSGLDNLANKVAEVYRQGGKPADALQLVPAGVRNYVEALGTGTALPKDIGFRQRTMLMNLAKIVYPGTTDAMFDARTKWAQQLESGAPASFGGQITSMNKIVDHAAHALEVLPNISGPVGSGLSTDFGAGKLNEANAYLQQLQGNTEFQKNKGAYDSFISGLAYEKSKLLSGGQPSQGEWKTDMDAMDPAKVGPSAAKAAIMSNLKLMLGQGKGIANQRNMAFPDKVTAEDLLQPQNKAFLKSVGITSDDMNQNSTLAPKTAAPEGKTVSPSGQTWTDPKTGKTYHVINGKLYE